MIYAVLLCDKQWKIGKIRQDNQILDLQEGLFLSEMVVEKEKLRDREGEYSLELTFFQKGIVIPAIIQAYKEGNLVVLVSVKNDREFLEFTTEYPKYREWAQDWLFGIFHNEYYMIQQMNNRLVDLQRKLTRSNRQLERANRSKTRFLANMSHDIRTPMNAIIGLTELMLHNLEDPEVLERYIYKLRSSGQYLLDLINDILELSKIENGLIELKPEPMDIGSQLEQILTIIRPQITEKEQQIAIEGTVEHRYVIADSVHLRQVMMNVLSNAVKYTPKGGNIRLEVRERKIEKGDNTTGSYEFVIEDSGIGMSPAFAKHIFEPFSRAEDSASEIQGTGLGMAITKSIVDAMKGTIRVESEPGKGSRFEITLPLILCREEELRNKEKDQINIQNDEKPSIKGKRFLCAEDNELNAEILTSILELEGAKCRIYGNGKLLTEAFENVTPGEYDAILMDVQMPVMNGYEATKEIRNGNNPLGRTIPIIAMSANAFQEDVNRSLQAGMNAHISKPLDIKRLIEVLDIELKKLKSAGTIIKPEKSIPAGNEETYDKKMDTTNGVEKDPVYGDR